MKTDLIKYVTGYSPEITNEKYIDIAIEFNINLFKEVGIEVIPHPENRCIKTEVGTFYCGSTDENISWFWAITNKSLNSRKFDSIKTFYLMDGDTATRINTRKKIWRKFKKDLEPGLIKALKEFIIEEE